MIPRTTGSSPTGLKVPQRSKQSKPRKQKKTDSYSTFIYKILRAVSADMGISNKAMAIMNTMVVDILKRIMREIEILEEQRQFSTLGAREIQTAVRLLFPGEISKHAVAEGVKAVTKYSSQAGENSLLSKSARVGAVFPVGRVRRFLVETWRNRVGATASVYVTAVLDYIVSEVLDLAGNGAKDNKQCRITPRHIYLAIRNDDELNKLFPGTVPGGGVIPAIHLSLLPNTLGDDS